MSTRRSVRRRQPHTIGGDVTQSLASHRLVGSSQVGEHLRDLVLSELICGSPRELYVDTTAPVALRLRELIAHCTRWPPSVSTEAMVDEVQNLLPMALAIWSLMLSVSTIVHRSSGSFLAEGGHHLDAGAGSYFVRDHGGHRAKRRADPVASRSSSCSRRQSWKNIGSQSPPLSERQSERVNDHLVRGLQAHPPQRFGVVQLKARAVNARRLGDL